MRRRARTLLWLLVTLGCPAVTTSALAEDSMRCGTRLVYQGDVKGKVRALCGEPSDITVTSIAHGPGYMRYPHDYAYYGPVWLETPIEVWTYNFGSSRLLRQLRFVGDELVDIRTNGYGY
jgi:uncharacterized protein DUF2845